MPTSVPAPLRSTKENRRRARKFAITCRSRSLHEWLHSTSAFLRSLRGIFWEDRPLRPME